MSWVTPVWSLSVGTCWILALLHFFVWLRGRDAWANLLFAIIAVTVSLWGLAELAMMRSHTPDQFATALRRAAAGWSGPSVVCARSPCCSIFPPA